MTDIHIREGQLEAAVDLLMQIPEFDDIPSMETIRQRLTDVPQLVLTAHRGEQVVGTKIGYQREDRFYSWLGAVHPDERQQGIAGALADYQEQWAKRQGYTLLGMKTRNRFPAMLMMAIGRGFYITSIDPLNEVREHRIWLEKSI